MVKKPIPFLDTPRACKCGYCKRPEVRAFLDGGLRATRDGGHPRPKKQTVANAITAEFGTPENTAKHWLRCCKLWTDPWPGESDG